MEKIIGLDLDGVIIDHTANKIKVGKSLGVDIDLADTPTDILGDILDPSVWRAIKRILYDDPVIALTPPLMVGVENGLRFLKENHYKYFLISRRKSTATAFQYLKTYSLWNTILTLPILFLLRVRQIKIKKLKSSELIFISMISPVYLLKSMFRTDFFLIHCGYILKSRGIRELKLGLNSQQYLDINPTPPHK